MYSPWPTRSDRKAASRLARAGWAALLIGWALNATACGREIGDECHTSVDCSLNGDRFCDISQPGGYCTVDGCDETSCPDEAICVRFFPVDFLTKTCIYTPPAAAQSPMPDGCNADELCLPSNLCAPRSTERRYCTLRCGGGGDCRGGYECRVIGQQGSVALTPAHEGKKRFCAPRAP